MNSYLKIALPIGIVCALLSLMIGGVCLLVIGMHSLDPTAQLPFFYFSMLNLPVLAAALPVLGIVALLPLALRVAFAGTAAEAAKAVETNSPAFDAGHLKAA